MLSVGNSGGAISGQIYRSQDAPRFILGHAINLGFCAMGLITASILFIALRLENRRRGRLYGTVDINNNKTDVTTTTTTTTKKQIVDILEFCSEEDRRRWGYENLSEQEIRDLGDKHAAWRYIL
jgi:hypothetical protein